MTITMTITIISSTITTMLQGSPQRPGLNRRRPGEVVRRAEARGDFGEASFEGLGLRGFIRL